MMSLHCAYCDHPRRNHHRYLGSGLRPGGHGQCLVRGCPCEKFKEACDVHRFAINPLYARRLAAELIVVAEKAERDTKAGIA